MKFLTVWIDCVCRKTLSIAMMMMIMMTTTETLSTMMMTTTTKTTLSTEAQERVEHDNDASNDFIFCFPFQILIIFSIIGVYNGEIIVLQSLG